MSIFNRNKEKPKEYINTDNVKFTCKIGSMGKEGKMIWIPKRYQPVLEKGTYVEVKIRKLK